MHQLSKELREYRVDNQLGMIETVVRGEYVTWKKIKTSVWRRQSSLTAAFLVLF